MKTSNFYTFAPPERATAQIDFVETNGAELHCTLIKPDVPTQMLINGLAAKMTKKYVALDMREGEPGDNDPEPIDFPQTPKSGVITLTENSCALFAQLALTQVVKDDEEPLSFESWVYCSIMCPGGFGEAIKAVNRFNKPVKDDGKGNRVGKLILEASPSSTENPLSPTPTDSSAATGN